MGAIGSWVRTGRAGSACAIAAAILAALAVLLGTTTAGTIAMALAVVTFTCAAVTTWEKPDSKVTFAPVSLSAALALVCIPATDGAVRIVMTAIFASCCLCLASACNAKAA